MKFKRGKYLLFAVLLATSVANAADVAVKNAWVRGTVPAQMMSGAFMELTSKRNAALVRVSTPVAEEAEIHEMRLENGVMKMRAVPRLALPAGKTVTLKPGGDYHIMLMGLKRQLKPGSTVPFTLMIERANNKVEAIAVNAEVRELTSSSAPDQHDHQH